MAPRKSSESAAETGYPVLLYKLCKEEDVLIIPQFVTQLTSRQLEAGPPSKRSTLQESGFSAHQKSKEFKTSDKSVLERSSSERYGVERHGSDRHGSERHGSERHGSERHGSERHGSERHGSERYGSDRFLHSLTDTKMEDPLLCGNIPPPQVGIIYENPEDKETPVAVICRNIYIEFALISAIGKSLRPYPTLSCLKIENCCISREIAEALALLLAEDSGKWISDLSLDGNEGIADVLPLFVKLSTGLRYLSLERCSLDDLDVEMLAEALSYGDGKDLRLQCLNLSMNKIGDGGLCHLAEALRTNRSLMSLSLAGNQIHDEGVACLTEVLQKFPLTYNEILMRRRRVFDTILRKKNAVEKHLEELKSKAETPVKKSNDRNAERMGRRVRGADGKIRCLPPKSRSEALRLNSGEKFLGRVRSGTEEGTAGVEATPSEILEITRQVEAEMLPDRHPFINEVQLTETGAWCQGCWSLGSVNLAFNYLTDSSLEGFNEVLRFQTENYTYRTGLSRLVLLPGNLFRENHPEYQKLQTAIIYKNTRKESFEERSFGGSPSTARGTSSAKLSKRLTEQIEAGTFQKT